MNTPPSQPEPPVDLSIDTEKRPLKLASKPTGVTVKVPTWVASIGKGILCSAVVTLCVQFTNIKQGIIYVCGLVTAVSAPDPRIEKLKKKAEVALDKMEKEEGEGKKPRFHIPKPAEVIAQKSKEVIGDGVEKGKEVVTKAAEPVKAGIEKATDKVEEGVTALKNIGPGGGQGMDAPPAGARQAMPRTATGTIVNAFSRGNAAHANNMTNDGASYADFWAEVGPNGKCPNPACKFPMKVPPKSRASYRCPNLRCGWTTSAVHIRAMGAPEPPRTPPLAYSAWREKKLKEIDEQAKKPQAAPKAAPLVGPPKPESPAVTQASGEAAR